MLRLAGALLILIGAWVFIQSLIAMAGLYMKDEVTPKAYVTTRWWITVLDSWGAVLFYMALAFFTWCAAVIAFGLGHAMYVLRDIAHHYAIKAKTL